MQEGFLGVGEGRVYMHPLASAVESTLEKICACVLGRVHGLVRCEERNNWLKVNKDLEGLPHVSDLRHFFAALLLT